MIDSLHARLLWVATGVVGAAVAVIGLSLDTAFRSSAEEAQRERLQGHVYTLLAAITMTPDGLSVDAPLPEPRFARPRSGLYAWVLSPEGQALWRSRSVLGADREPPAPVAPGKVLHDRAHGLYRLRYGVAWEQPAGAERRFALVVAESPEALAHQVAAFRRTLWGWLGLGAIGLLGALAAVLRWTLEPLRRVASDLDRIRRGEAERLPAVYPREIRLLTESINERIDAERERGERFRRNLDNLAHSLKTPLAVLRGALDTTTAGNAAAEQINRIDDAVEYYVRRGGAGMTSAGERTPVLPVARRLLHAVARAHPEKSLHVTVAGDEALRFAGSEADLMELLGNLLDNAYKWAHSAVTVHVASTDDGAWLELVVSDDGPGIPAEQRRMVLEHGTRGGKTVPGEGIGLAVVSAVATAYRGDLSIGDAPDRGGARIAVRLPAG